MAVAAVRRDGRVASYSSPGACLLAGALSGDLIDSDEDGYPDAPDPDAPDVLTTDRTAGAGYNADASEAGDYAFFDGTSASSPQIAGVAALLLAANPSLTYRDAQQIHPSSLPLPSSSRSLPPARTITTPLPARPSFTALLIARFARRSIGN